MAQALTAPIAIAALVLCIAGLAKLRGPDAAARAARGVGIPAGRLTIRLFALIEAAVGTWALLAPDRVAGAALCAIYALFAVVSARLANRRVACGCFGTGEEQPASVGQSVLSAAFAVLAAASVVWSSRGAGWVLARPALTAGALIVGLLGGAYAAVLAYTELPRAWGAWTRA